MAVGTRTAMVGPVRCCALAVLAGLLAAPPAGAVADGGGSQRSLSTVGSPDPGPRRYSPPVSAPVVDPFRMPFGPYGPGNRGLEYRTEPGQRVVAIGAGRVAFVGVVVGRLVISIDHPDGRRSALTGLAVVTVEVGDALDRGQMIGLTGSSLHLGVREAGRYVDPAALFGRRGPARLVSAQHPRDASRTGVGR